MSSQTPNEPAGVGMEWLENRRAALERFLCRTAKHPVLCIDPDFINFLQSDEELPKAVNTAALSGAGVMRLFNRVGETVNKITYKMDENDSVRCFVHFSFKLLWSDRSIAVVRGQNYRNRKSRYTHAKITFRNQGISYLP